MSDFPLDSQGMEAARLKFDGAATCEEVIRSYLLHAQGVGYAPTGANDDTLIGLASVARSRTENEIERRNSGKGTMLSTNAPFTLSKLLAVPVAETKGEGC